MDKVHLAAASDHVRSLAHERDPLRAIIEIVWNSLDADAHRVDIEFDKNGLGGVEKVTIRDDGHGMSPESSRTDFAKIGGS